MKTWIFKTAVLVSGYLLLNTVVLFLAAPMFVLLWNGAAPAMFHLPRCDVKTAFCLLATVWLARQLSAGVGLDLKGHQPGE